MDVLEQAMTAKLIAQLKERGLNPRREVRTPAGTPDLVSDTAVYEMIGELTAEKLQAAMTHVLACRDAIDAKRRAVVYATTIADGYDLEQAIIAGKERGVTVNLWRDGDKPGMN